jgi:hypothetical protein
MQSDGRRRLGLPFLAPAQPAGSRCATFYEHPLIAEGRWEQPDQ